MTAWRGTRYWEDVQEGDVLPAYSLLLDPLRMHLQTSGTQDYHRQHHDEAFAHQQGTGGTFVNTGFTQAVLARLVFDWMGDAGFLTRFQMEMRKMNRPGDTMHLSGRVVRTWQEDGVGYVECELSAANDREGVTTPGRAVVRLPRRNAPPEGSVIMPERPVEHLPPRDAPLERS
jgi:acyl dehydratase